MSALGKHVAPHELAGLSQGRLSDSEATRIQRHLGGCASCAAKHRQILAGLEAMSEISEVTAPELGWDHIGARVYWSTSSERRANARAPRRRRRRYGWSLGGLSVAVVAGAVLWVALPEADKTDTGRRAQPVAAYEMPPPPTPPVATKPAVEPITGVVVLAQGDVRTGDEPLDIDTFATAGRTYATGAGQLVIQFGESSAFRLGEHSTLRIDRLDSAKIALRVEGIVDVDITRRPPGQEFVVAAGSHEVQVRGTAFRVDYQDGDLGVRCVRGQVVVTDGGPAVNVSAGQRFEVLRDALSTAALRAMPIDSEALESLDRSMQMPMLPTWEPDGALIASTAVLEVDNPSEEAIAVDGTYIGAGTFMLRTSGGQHEVSYLDADGELVRGRHWNAESGTRIKARPAKPTKPARAERAIRKQQLAEAMERSPRAQQCLAQLAKQRLLAGAYLVLDVGVNPDGSQSYLNVLDSNLHPAIQTCLQNVAAAQELPKGSAAAFRMRLSY